MASIDEARRQYDAALSVWNETVAGSPAEEKAWHFVRASKISLTMAIKRAQYPAWKP